MIFLYKKDIIGQRKIVFVCRKHAIFAPSKTQKNMLMLKQILLMLGVSLTMAASAESLEECQQLAEQNYPLVLRYDLIRQTEQYTLSNIARSWLPQISMSAQATYQSAMTELPDALKGVMAGQGMSVRGLSPLQYRGGLDVQQTLYDGGMSLANRSVARAQTAVEMARNEVELYQVRDRVNDLYFGWLLAEERLRQNDALTGLMKANVEKLEALYNNGVAMACDVDMMRAEMAGVRQQRAELESVRTSLRQVLSLFCGKDIGSVSRPEVQLAADRKRPELTLFDQQLELLTAREKTLRARLMPRVGLFAQGYYGYMGLDMYRDMFHRTPTLNGLLGAKLSWNLSSLYTRKNDRSKLMIDRQEIENARETFLFNQSLLSTQEQQNIKRYQALMAEDTEIVTLRRNVREAAEAKLRGGIIDTSNLIQELTRENQAIINQSIHEMEYLKAIYELNHIQGK